MSMPTITVWQPWASLIAAGFKPYEFRGWAAPHVYRGRRIAIHAGARPVRKGEVADLIMRLRHPTEARLTGLTEGALEALERAYSNPTLLPLSHVVCTAVLGTPINGFDAVESLGAIVNDSDRDQHANYAWPLTDIEPLTPPVPTKGSQGFWSWAG